MFWYEVCNDYTLDLMEQGDKPILEGLLSIEIDHGRAWGDCDQGAIYIQSDRGDLYELWEGYPEDFLMEGE